MLATALAGRICNKPLATAAVHSLNNTPGRAKILSGAVAEVMIVTGEWPRTPYAIDALSSASLPVKCAIPARLGVNPWESSIWAT
ncbi:hypothetical protein NPX13_g8372 [Xylaria arbuscula]|uniref:Uncharacterized protein n=1 Tax=Xylaria arbuscula TaxID=114810 RepID=A0A9W8N931_9PEZI|nr:hypothetical protein NPX13_g8372 [Xylaria arbuscula]